MQKTKILIATGNEGKFKEISSFFSTLSYVEFVSLKDLSPVESPAEPGRTIEANALLKARYYAEKTGLIALADDSGLYIKQLDGYPGVDTALQGDTDEERLNTVLSRAAHLKEGERDAYFASCVILYNPATKTWFSAYGEMHGYLSTKEAGPVTKGLPFDAVFFNTEVQKINSLMTLEEKNKYSHRGKALEKMSFYIRNNFAPKQVVVPCAFILHEGKILMSLRNDPHQKQFHKKWEFPGGGVEVGETVHENIVREVKEEVGFDVEVIRLLQHVQVEMQTKQSSSSTCQIFLLPHICRITGGKLKPSNEEVIEARWFSLDEVLNYELIGTNADMYKQVYNELRECL